LILRPRCLVIEAPKKLLPYFDTVRKASDWRLLNFQVKLDEHGYPVRETSKKYEFNIARESDPLIAKAIQTGKKAVNHPLPVFDYVLGGCDLSEFVDLTDDVKAFCQGNLLRIKGKILQALPLLEKACHLNPDEVRYREVYYPLRLMLGDLSSINDELIYFERDMDSIIHTGRFGVWMKALIAAKEYSKARQVISRVDKALLCLADGSTTAQFYTKQKSSWYDYKREQFSKQAEKFSSRIQKLEEKASRPISKNKTKDNHSNLDGISQSVAILRGTDVSEVLYNFTQCSFIGECNNEPLDLSVEVNFFARLTSSPLNLIEAHQLPPKYRRLLRELLSQYIMFLEMNRDLLFPSGFLDGSSKEQLGLPLLQYIHRHRWPFPQMLPSRSA
jgi:hypothetical protein